MAFLEERELIPGLHKVKDMSWADDIRPGLCYSRDALHEEPPSRPTRRVKPQLAACRPATVPTRRVHGRTSAFRSADPRRKPCTGIRSKLKCLQCCRYAPAKQLTLLLIIYSYAFTINLGGEKFYITKPMVAHDQESLLAELDHRHESYDEEADEYFFDRSAGFFPYIRDHLEGLDTHFPHCFCPRALLTELDFWKLPPTILNPCCSKFISEYLAEQDTIKQLERAILKPKVTPEEYANMKRSERWKKYVYHFLDDPATSIYAQVWVGVYTMMVLTSITIACLVTVQDVRVPAPSATACLQYINRSARLYNTCATTIPDYIWWSSIILNVIFFIEMLTKIYTFPHKRSLFFKNFLNLMDIIAVILTLITNFMLKFAPEFWQNNIASLSSLNALASVLRVGRLMQAFKHNRHLRVLVLTLRYSKGDLLVLLFLLLIAMLIYAVAIYIAEYEEPDQFSSIPLGMWWSLITMTTVGYNDFRPITNMGYLVGAVCAMLGVVITGSAIPLSASSFERLSGLSRQVGAKR